MNSEEKTGNGESEQSPFKVYEDKYCSRCADYPGCIGLIDQIAVKMQEENTPIKIPAEFAQFLNQLSNASRMQTTQRFGMIATCMAARHHIEHHTCRRKKPGAKKQED